jgi:hypothetical protein
MMQTNRTIKKEEEEEVFIRSCNYCNHVSICLIYRAIDGLLSNNFPSDKKPFEVAEIAKICKLFTPVYLKAASRGFNFNL